MSSSGYNGALQGVIPWFDPIPNQARGLTIGRRRAGCIQEMGYEPVTDRVGIEAHRRQAGDRLTSDDTKAAELHVSAKGCEREWINRQGFGKPGTGAA